ncbi:MAG: efflux transporter outer membrane subunit [Pseudomonadales bacterium]|nr:efflux transporter outer membrane subunit [Pseudomonadales bacterium]
MKTRLLGFTIPMILAACSLAPVYRVPSTAAIPDGFKEAPGWRVATPADGASRGTWWSLLGDPMLDSLEARALVSNQNLAAAKAAYDSARALVREQRAAYLPTVGLNANANRPGTFADRGSSTVNTSSSARYVMSLGASWEPDLWGRIGNMVSEAGASAAASGADLASATLSVQGELALNYVQLRGIEAQQVILAATLSDYEKAVTITTNRYDAGVVARSDVLQAETALHNARANAADLERQRAILEHAIATLVGENASSFTLPNSATPLAVPEVPGVLPAALMERRPDIAAAERRVAAANASIGIQRAAFFPAIDLSGDAGYSALSTGVLFEATSSVWSLGLTGALALLDFGARSANVDKARAAYEQTVAQYRQTVLTAFQQTEDALAAVRVLQQVALERDASATAATRAEAIARNQYLAGTIGYSDLIVVQTNSLAARSAAAQSVTDRQSAAIALLQAIGGDWRTSATAGQ